MSAEENNPWSRVIKSSRLKIGQKKMRSVKEMTGLKRRRNIMIARTETGLHATGTMQAHGMATGLGRKDRRRLHNLPIAPIKVRHLFRRCERMVPISTPAHVWEDARKMRKERPLEIHEVRDSEGWIEVRLSM